MDQSRGLQRLPGLFLRESLGRRPCSLDELARKTGGRLRCGDRLERQESDGLSHEILQRAVATTKPHRSKFSKEMLSQRDQARITTPGTGREP